MARCARAAAGGALAAAGDGAAGCAPSGGVGLRSSWHSHRGCDSALHAAERALNVANDQVNELSARLAREQAAREAAEVELRAAQDVAFELRGSASPRACERRGSTRRSSPSA